MMRSRASWVVVAAFLLAMAAPRAEAAQKVTNINIVPVVTSLRLHNGQLLASGHITSVIKGVTKTVQFADVPVLIGTRPNPADRTCPILELELGPINLDLLGLQVRTSKICVTITAHRGEGLLGDLLCDVAGLLDRGFSLRDILAGILDPLTGLPVLTPGQITRLIEFLTGVELLDILNQALQAINNAVLTNIQHVNRRGTCAILTLVVGPLDLNLLGLEIELDNCAGGPVVVTITAQTGKGKLLGNLLCQLLDGGLLGGGLTLGQLLDLLERLLTQ